VVLLGASLAGLGVTVSAAELQQATIDAFNRYVKATEARQASSAPFLWFEGLAQVPRSKAEERLRRGEFVIDRLRTTDAGRAIETPDGLVHHWIGVVLVKGVSIDQAVALLQDYDRHGEIYTPNVARSKLLSRRGDDFKLSLRFFMEKATIGVVINSEHEARFTRHSPDRVSSRIYSTRIVEVEHPDTRREREKPEGRDEGYLWRLNSYWRFQQRPEGVYIQCESITLTRDIPLGLGWLLGGFVTAIPQETLSFTLETTRKTLLARAKTGA
jgi:hypothetical protein